MLADKKIAINKEAPKESPPYERHSIGGWNTQGNSLRHGFREKILKVCTPG
ncbi:hypothetical protein PFUM301597_41920 [Pseudomonas fluorescens]